jgi:hypothetical protein
VVHVTVAEIAVMPLDVTALITGTVTVDRVDKVKLADAALPAESPEITA